MSIPDRIMRRLCIAVAERLPEPRVYHGREGRYLTRWSVIERATSDEWGLALNFFHTSDEDRELHTHPWAWAIALQLAGGYHEDRRVGNGVVRTRFGPGSLVFLTQDTAHRVDLLDPDRGSWSLILTGPIVASWGFYDPVTWTFTPWREFIRRKGLQPLEPQHVP